MRSARSPPICGTGVFSFDRTPCEWVVRPKGDVDMELKFHYSATRAELMSSEGRWYVTFVMIDAAANPPRVHISPRCGRSHL